MKSIMMRRLRLQTLKRPCSSYSYSTSFRSLSYVEILPEVKDALSTNKPVVALESTILSHGLPYPENKQLSREVSRIIRSKGAGKFLSLKNWFVLNYLGLYHHFLI